MKKKKKGYALFLVITIILTLLAISTLIPDEGASKTCYFGYNAHCSFTPFSTIILLLLTAACCALRKRKYTEDFQPESGKK